MARQLAAAQSVPALQTHATAGLLSLPVREKNEREGEQSTVSVREPVVDWAWAPEDGVPATEYRQSSRVVKNEIYD